MRMRWKQRRPFDLQTKIVLVLVGVIVPTYLLVTIIQNQLTQPMLEQDLRQVGVSTAEALSAQILSRRMLGSPNATHDIETAILERLYFQPSIIRMDVYERLGDSNDLKLVASSVDDDPTSPPFMVPFTDQVTAELAELDENSTYWKILVPIKQISGNRRSSRAIGLIHVAVSTKTVNRVLDRIWKITAFGALASILIAVGLLSYFLRKTIANERLLKKTENENVLLAEQLHEVQRQMMNTEKLAAMGQLTANFAHEIGTPLNAIGGHLQLLKEDLPRQDNSTIKKKLERVEIITGELGRIEKIVKNFLQTTSKPESQRQLVDANALVDKILNVAKPRLDMLPVEVERRLDRQIGPVRVVPTDIEQILLNLINNSFDSLKLKVERSPLSKLQLSVFSEIRRKDGEEWVYVGVHDTGVGIARKDLKNVAKPFFTTKRPGEGTGLGLAICQQIAANYGGTLEFDSKEGAWAECRLGIPYRSNT